MFAKKVMRVESVWRKGVAAAGIGAAGSLPAASASGLRRCRCASAWKSTWCVTFSGMQYTGRPQSSTICAAKGSTYMLNSKEKEDEGSTGVGVPVDELAALKGRSTKRGQTHRLQP